jgi:poly-gamma-glutamate synthesis protein (capsule biosynthesis protein)
MTEDTKSEIERVAEAAELMTLFLCGDVMLGRGIDQILPHPSDPRLYESYMESALDYVALAETANGPIQRPVDYAYVWGDALDLLTRARPDVRIINLETSVTRSEDFDPKGINYRMNPANVPCLSAAEIDCCVLANNHVLDWGRAGLLETLASLQGAGMASPGAGETIEQASAPSILTVPGKGRVIIFALGSTTSGIPPSWAATDGGPGVNLLAGMSERTVRAISRQVKAVKEPGDIVVASIHWGDNWGYHVARAERGFAHALIDQAGVDIIHGHSSHHAKAIEVYNGRPILYGCGDFLNDYEGIKGYEDFRDDLALMYFLAVDPSNGQLVRLDITPLQIRNFQLKRATDQDARWVSRRLSREGEKFGTRLELAADNRLELDWR